MSARELNCEMPSQTDTFVSPSKPEVCRSYSITSSARTTSIGAGFGSYMRLMAAIPLLGRSCDD